MVTALHSEHAHIQTHTHTHTQHTAHYTQHTTTQPALLIAPGYGVLHRDSEQRAEKRLNRLDLSCIKSIKSHAASTHPPRATSRRSAVAGRQCPCSCCQSDGTQDLPAGSLSAQPLDQPAQLLLLLLLNIYIYIYIYDIRRKCKQLAH